MEIVPLRLNTSNLEERRNAIEIFLILQGRKTKGSSILTDKYIRNVLKAQKTIIRTFMELKLTEQCIDGARH